MSLRTLALAAALAAASVVTTPAFAADKDDVLAVVNQFNDDGNKLDEKAASALCADQTVIIDMFAPYSWNGAGACATWMKDGDADNKRTSSTDVSGTLGKTSEVIISGDNAYAAMPATFTYKIKGKAQKPLQGIWTFTMHKSSAGWRITGLGWGLKSGI